MLLPQPPRGWRLGLVADRYPASAGLVRRLLRVAIEVLPQAYVNGEFAFTLAADADAADGDAGAGGPAARVRPRGLSARYGAIACLGLRRLPEPDRRAVLAGDDCDDLVGRQLKRLDETTSLGDVALACWAAAEAGHSELTHALDRLRALDPPPGGPVDVVAAAWVVTALVAARRLADVEQHLATARDRLLGARRAVFPHVVGGSGWSRASWRGASCWHRAHVGSFADQVYPIQALARLHGSADDPKALRAAERVAAAICQAQGQAGQWWWHYDARTGQVVEGYPVYSVHQHAMAPMALFDLSEAGGTSHIDAICRGLAWLSEPAETKERLVVDDPPMIWRKVARGDRRKVVRGLRAASTRLRPGARWPQPQWSPHPRQRGRVRLLDRAYPPGAVDHECRPYELGWLLHAWLPDLAAPSELATLSELGEWR